MSESLAINYTASKTLSRFHRDDSFVRAIVGPFGSGKSVGCVMDMLMRSAGVTPGPDGIRRTRWGVVRNTYRELRDTTLRTFEEWVPQAIRTWHESDCPRTRGCAFSPL